MKTGSYLAATLLAVTMTMATAGAQDPGPPPNDPQAQGPAQGQSPGQGPSQDQQADPNNSQNPNDAQNPSLVSVAQQSDRNPTDPNQQSDQPYDANKEDPKTSVARVSLVKGDVSMQRGDATEWSGVSLNTPLVQGDQLATGDKGRAEVELDFANMLRMAAGTQVKIADLERNRIQLQVSQGYTSYSVFKGNEAEIEIDTPNVAFRPTRPGRYRVQVSSDAESTLIVREGEVEVNTPQGSTTVKEGQIITVRGTDDPEYKVETAPPSDDWDKWNVDRDHSIQSAGSWQNTNRYYTGSNDLDANGRWINVPGYGQVWQPYNQTENPNWAPYQDGRWVWEPGWGWTWVSNEPWGWAPYHYGRWFNWNAGWVWWPGPIYPYYRPLWAPAYVSFFGFGGHFGFGFGFGSVGWLPVGPFDPFFPWYGRGFNRITFVGFNTFGGRGFGGHFVGPLGIRGRMTEFSNIHMAMTNARVRAGITSVSGADFARGGLGSRRIGADVGQLRNAHMMTSNVPVVPTRESLRTGNTRSGFSGLSGSNGRFMTNHTPPQGPASFHEQASRIQSMVSNPRGTMNEAGNGRLGNAESSSRGESTFSRPTNTGESVRAQNQSGSNSGSRDGWNRFGGSSGQPTNNSRGGNFGNANGNRGTWGGAGSSSSGKPPLQMAKPIVTPRTPSTPTYSRPASPGNYGGNYGGYNASHAPANSRSYGGYNPGSSGGYYGGRGSSGNYGSSRGPSSYGGSSHGGGNYSGGRSGGGSHSSGGHTSGGGHSSGGHSGGHK
jgi:Family of unknown function (DUF6600)/FecR protein